jgi:hypothetical protein
MLLNNYHFMDIGLPVTGNSKIKLNDQPANIVNKAKENIKELLDKLEQFLMYLNKNTSVFHKAQLQLI